MFVTIRTYEIGRGNPTDLGRIAQGEFLNRIDRLPGFRAYYLIEGDGGNRLASVGVFANQESAEESDRIATEWVHDRLEGAVLSDAEVTQGDVLVSVVSPQAVA